MADAPCMGSDGQWSSLQNLPDIHACPQLDLTEPWNLHLHGADDTLAFGSPQCQSRVKAAAHRARKAAS